MKKIILTGASGFIGSNFLEYLLEKTDYKVVCILNKSGLKVRNYDKKRVEIVRGNLFRYEEAQAVIRDADYLIHMAGRVGNAATVNDLTLYTDDITLTANVARAAAENGIKKMLYCSSSTGYPDKKLPIKEEEYFCKEPAYFGYGWMRRYIEKLLEHLSKSTPMEIVVARAGAVYGCYDNFDLKTCHFVPALIKKYLDKDSKILKIWGDENLKRDLMFAEDFVEGCMTVFERENLCDAINIGTGITHSISDVIMAIEAVVQEEKLTKLKRWKWQSDKPTAIPYRCLNVSRLKEIGFKPKHNLSSGIKKTIRWHLESVSKAMEFGRDV